jgi:hypothetical protein
MKCSVCGKGKTGDHPRCLLRAQPRTAAREDSAIGRMPQPRKDAILRAINGTPRSPSR